MKPTFDLNSAIETWRASFHGTAVGSADLGELETHLRDSFAELSARGISEDESFHVACRRLGGAEVAREFTKVNPEIVWAERAKWMFFGVLGFNVLSCGLQTCRSLVGVAISRFDTDGTNIIWQSSLTALATVGVSALAFIQIAKGKWQLTLSKKAAILTHPAAVAVVFGCLIIVSWFGAILPFSIGKQGPQVVGKLAVTRTYIELGVALIMPVLLALALRIAQRRANPAT